MNTTATTWNEVQEAAANLDAAAAAYDANPTDEASVAWETARDALDATVRAYKAGR